MKNLLYAFIFCCITIVFSSCTNNSTNTQLLSLNKIELGFGPEDILIDSLSSNSKRLLISCASRREKDNPQTNGIYAMNLSTNAITKLERVNEPANLLFRPHGFDMAKIGGAIYLFVINHEDNKGRQSILKYKVQENQLLFDSLIMHSKIISPNDIFVNNDGSFYISNDASKRGNRMELLLGQKKGSLVYFSINGAAIELDTALAYPNGVFATQSHVWVSTVGENSLYRYEIASDSFTNKTLLTNELQGGDNISLYQNSFIIPGHPNFLQFFLHKINSDYHSPSIVYQYHLDKQSLDTLFIDDGSRISAASTAIFHQGHLYISQVFDPFILKVKIE